MKPIARRENIVVQDTRDETLVYDLNTNKAVCLNKTSALVWELCDGRRTIEEISQSLSRKLNSNFSEDLVWLTLDKLKKEKLLANGDELPVKFAGMSRREVVKRVGLGSMIALPVICGIIAPTSVNAASGAACGTINGPCPLDNFMQSTCCPNLRCDQLTVSTGLCRPCFNTGTSFGLGSTVPQCDARPEKNLCCNPTGTPTVGPGSSCLCP